MSDDGFDELLDDGPLRWVECQHYLPHALGEPEAPLVKMAGYRTATASRSKWAIGLVTLTIILLCSSDARPQSMPPASYCDHTIRAELEAALKQKASASVGRIISKSMATTRCAAFMLADCSNTDHESVLLDALIKNGHDSAVAMKRYLWSIMPSPRRRAILVIQATIDKNQDQDMVGQIEDIALRDWVSENRMIAIEALGRIGDVRSIKALKKIIENENEPCEFRIETISVLRSFGRAADGMVGSLIAIVKKYGVSDNDNELKMVEAARMTSSFLGPKAALALYRLLGDRTQKKEAREAAGQSLFDMTQLPRSYGLNDRESKYLLGRLARYLDDGDTISQGWAIDLVGTLASKNDQHIMRSLRKIMLSRDRVAACRASDTFYQISGDCTLAFPVLLAGLASSNIDVRDEAFQMLCQMSDVCARYSFCFTIFVFHPDPTTRDRALYLISYPIEYPRIYDYGVQAWLARIVFMFDCDEQIRSAAIGPIKNWFKNSK